MRWIVYETRCLVSGKIYVGVHRQDEDGFDGYLGSGTALKRAIKKHTPEAREKIREANLRRWANHRNNAA